MNEKKKAECERLFTQCLEAYEDSKNSAWAMMKTAKTSFPVPSVFDDRFRVPEELLFQEACEINKSWIGERQDFSKELLLRISTKKEFDIDWIVRKTKASARKRAYTVYAEIFYFNDVEKKRSRPFSRVIKVKDCIFEWLNKREFSKLEESFLEQEKRRDKDSLMAHSVRNLKELRRFPKISKEQEKFIHPIRTTIHAADAFSATEKAVEKLSWLIDCFNVSQAKGRLKTRISGGDPRTMDSKTTMTTTGLYLTVGEDGKKSYFNSGVYFNKIPKQTYDSDINRRKNFELLVSAITENSPIRERISGVIHDLAISYETEDSGLRQLGFWRCLEHATRKNGGTRKEKEIIEIFGNYRDEVYWKQMGKIVLKLRNEYVHVGVLLGENEVRDSYINYSQKYAESALNILLYLFKHQSTWNSNSAVDDFFDYYSKPDSSLRSAKALLAARNKK